jgi:small subunit ribosomal protein S8
MLTRIRNAVQAKKAEVFLPYSKFKASLAELLVKEGFLAGSNALEETGHKQLKLVIKYDPQGGSVISGIKRISKPGQRIYLPFQRIPVANSGFGLTVVSTSKGLMTDRQARKDKVGGEIVCQVW